MSVYAMRYLLYGCLILLSKKELLCVPSPSYTGVSFPILSSAFTERRAPLLTIISIDSHCLMINLQ